MKDLINYAEAPQLQYRARFKDLRKNNIVKRTVSSDYSFDNEQFNV